MPASRENRAASQAYWKANLRLVLGLLCVWFLVSYGFGILLVDVLNRVRIPGTGFPLGFWFAQQGNGPGRKTRLTLKPAGTTAQIT